MEREVKKFIEFLRENGVYDQYTENWGKGHGVKRFERNWESYLEHVKDKDRGAPFEKLFTYAFIWKETTQKHDFWMNLSNKWKRILRTGWDEEEEQRAKLFQL